MRRHHARPHPPRPALAGRGALAAAPVRAAVHRCARPTRPACLHVPDRPGTRPRCAARPSRHRHGHRPGLHRPAAAPRRGAGPGHVRLPGPGTRRPAAVRPVHRRVDEHHGLPRAGPDPRRAGPVRHPGGHPRHGLRRHRRRDRLVPAGPGGLARRRHLHDGRRQHRRAHRRVRRRAGVRTTAAARPLGPRRAAERRPAARDRRDRRAVQRGVPGRPGHRPDRRPHHLRGLPAGHRDAARHPRRRAGGRPAALGGRTAAAPAVLRADRPAHGPGRAARRDRVAVGRSHPAAGRRGQVGRCHPRRPHGRPGHPLGRRHRRPDELPRPHRADRPEHRLRLARHRRRGVHDARPHGPAHHRPDRPRPDPPAPHHPGPRPTPTIGTEGRRFDVRRLGRPLGRRG
ncbi:hypothetical protein SGPA1_11059 [Streptomyces misionensis JCM 4497]